MSRTRRDARQLGAGAAGVAFAVARVPFTYLQGYVLIWTTSITKNVLTTLNRLPY